MTRLNLNPFGSHGDAKSTFIVALIITVSTATFNIVLQPILASMQDEIGNTIPPGIFYPFVVVSTSVWLYFMFIFIRTRWYIRKKYHIPSRLCGPVEDVFCGFCCACCSISQMGRHTTNYGTNQAQCCTKTGLNPDVPSLDDIEQPPHEKNYIL